MFWWPLSSANIVYSCNSVSPLEMIRCNINCYLLLITRTTHAVVNCTVSSTATRGLHVARPDSYSFRTDGTVSFAIVSNHGKHVDLADIQGGAKNGPSYLIANILKTPWPNCVEIGELLQYYILNTVINFLFKNFIALWRHLAKTLLLCDA